MPPPMPLAKDIGTHPCHSLAHPPATHPLRSQPPACSLEAKTFFVHAPRQMSLTAPQSFLLIQGPYATSVSLLSYSLQARESCPRCHAGQQQASASCMVHGSTTTLHQHHLPYLQGWRGGWRWICAQTCTRGAGTPAEQQHVVNTSQPCLPACWTQQIHNYHSP